MIVKRLTVELGHFRVKSDRTLISAIGCLY